MLLASHLLWAAAAALLVYTSALLLRNRISLGPDVSSIEDPASRDRTLGLLIAGLSLGLLVFVSSHLMYDDLPLPASIEPLARIGLVTWVVAGCTLGAVFGCQHRATRRRFRRCLVAGIGLLILGGCLRDGSWHAADTFVLVALAVWLLALRPLLKRRQLLRRRSRDLPPTSLS